jgi:hypothetical protein
MKTIPSYIAYLLTKHECVIVPGLGAFVVSGPDGRGSNDTSLLSPPAKFLGFNSDIRHNDGLLANAIVKGETITYREACSQIARYVDWIAASVKNQAPVHIAWVGRLELSAERKWLFAPSTYLSCNAGVFGMDKFYLPAIQDLEDAEEYLPTVAVRSKRRSISRRSSRPSVVRRSLAIAAAILCLLMVAVPVTDHSVHQSTQMAGILSLPTVAPRESEAPQPVEVPVEEVTPYYIVVASLPTEALARRQMETLREQGVPTAGIIGSGDKHRVYVEKFSDKASANTFLNRFRSEHPRNGDAWLLFQRG